MWVGPKYANPELGPESLDNFEAGLDLIPAEGVKVTLSAYYAAGTDFLYYVTTGDSLFGRPIYIRENVTNVAIRGAEAELTYRIAEGLDVMANYTFSDAKINEFAERPELENRYLKYSPKHTASASLLWKNKILDAGIMGFYKSEQFSDDLNAVKLDSYFTLDMMLSKQVLQNFIISLDVQDVFDNQHMETGEYISPGRLINCRVAFRL